MVYCYESKNPLKVKKYKCIEIPDDMDIQLVPKRRSSTWQAEEQFRSIGSAHVGEQPIPEESIETPQAHKMLQGKHIKAGSGAALSKPREIPRDKNGRPLLLSPSHCKQVKHYATQYGVTDVLKWVERNCTFAKMFLPTATCEEINTLVASCYSQNYL
ncbi:hypothetical protein GCK32_001919 [Trichostrongylus colubriformis]|uniref:aECM cysteine-cradle domain-containing protein n=1 Tax=Trichostrongylus colubriformis TaxID=6319 RepID=A0AAN8FVC7_TRICO